VNRRLLPLVLLGAVAVGGCGNSATHTVARTTHPSAAAPKPHPQAIEPVAGAHGSSGSGGSTGSAGASDPSTIGDPNAHAPSLKTVKRELVQLNLCGGATSSAEAAPIVTGAGPGFVADPGTQQTEGQLPELTAELGALGKAFGVTIYGISGYRSPSHSVAVGGFADDPHTRGEAEDIGVDSLLRSSAARITEAELSQFHLYRPFDPSDDPGNTEVNHVQLIPNGGPLTLAAATSTYDPDPSCT
jgi:hypothetical protein